MTIIDDCFAYNDYLLLMLWAESRQFLSETALRQLVNIHL